MPKAIIFVKQIFSNKTDQDILDIIQDKHPDHMTLIFLKRGLSSYGYEVSLITWNMLPEYEFDGTELLVIPQQVFIAGTNKQIERTLKDFSRIADLGCSFILTHHHQNDFTKKFFDIEELVYRTSVIGELKIKGNEQVLSKGVQDFWGTSRRIINDEFTYLPPNSKNGFISVIEKIPLKKIRGFPKGTPFLCLGYKRLTKNNHVFLVDVHASGSKRGDNGDFFRLLLNNVLSFITNRTDDLYNDLTAINKSPELETTKKALIDARLGQGKYRAELIDYWKGCAVTTLKERALLRASHIKPWRDSTNEERLDKFNGLLLIPNLDLAFDKGFITFDSEGKIIISDLLTEIRRKILNINSKMKIKGVNTENEKYLKYHRKKVFKE